MVVGLAVILGVGWVPLTMLIGAQVAVPLLPLTTREMLVPTVVNL
jgi:hypothetical protein